MKSLVEMIEEAKENIKELEEAEKRTAKSIKNLQEELENITLNKVMFEKVLDDLTSIKNNEIQIVMAEKPQKENSNEIKETKGRIRPIIAIDENNETIASYKNQLEASKDLNINHRTVWYRISNITIEKQIHKYGYALTYGD